MEVLLWIAIFIISLAVLVKSAAYFTALSESLGKTLGISQFLIGVTVVALGTALPELVTGVIASIKDYSTIASGTVVGSNLANILLVLGLTAFIAKGLVFKRETIQTDLSFLLLATLLLTITLYDGSLSIIEGVILIAAYGFYVSQHWKDAFSKELSAKAKVDPRLIGFLVLAGAGIYVGATFVVDALTQLSSIWNVAPAVIAGTALAVGASLPELVVTLQAARRNNTDMILGNILGSSIVNSTLIMGIPALFGTLSVSTEVLVIAIPFLLLATALIMFAAFQQKVSRYEGALYGLIYLVFLGQWFDFL